MQEEAGGKYTLNKQGVEFSRYLEDEGWHIIPIKASDQLVGPCAVLQEWPACRMTTTCWQCAGFAA